MMKMPYIVDHEDIELLVGFDKFYDFARANFPEEEQDQVTEALKRLEEPSTQIIMLEPKEETGVFAICSLGSTSVNGGETEKQMTVLLFKSVPSLVLFLEHFFLDNQPILDELKLKVEKIAEEKGDIPEEIIQNVQLIKSIAEGCMLFLKDYYEDNLGLEELSRKFTEGR